MARRSFFPILALFLSYACDKAATPLAPQFLTTNLITVTTNVSTNLTVNYYYTNASSGTWAQISAAAPGLGSLYYHEAVLHNGVVYIYGDGAAPQKVYASTNGAAWSLLTSSAPNIGSKPYLYSLNGSMVAIPNSGGTIVYQSVDGITWNPVATNSLLAKLWGASCLLNGKIYISGGYEGGVYTNVVLSSPDGLSWSVVTNAAAFSGRYLHAMLSFKNRLWIIGGAQGSTPTSDVWNSDDGAVWNQVSSNHLAGTRMSFVAFVKGPSMHVATGWSLPATANAMTHFYSEDGVFWNQVASIAWPGRQASAGVNLANGDYLMIGGAGAGSDVWCFR